MSTYTFQLDFGGGDVRKGEMPGSVAFVALKTWSSSERDDSVIHVSSQCMGPTELEGEVRRLQRELESVLEVGRRKFADYKRATLEALREKDSQE